MAAATTALPTVPTRRPSRLRLGLEDTMTIAWRNIGRNAAHCSIISLRVSSLPLSS